MGDLVDYMLISSPPVDSSETERIEYSVGNKEDSASILPTSSIIGLLRGIINTQGVGYKHFWVAPNLKESITIDTSSTQYKYGLPKKIIAIGDIATQYYLTCCFAMATGDTGINKEYQYSFWRVIALDVENLTSDANSGQNVIAIGDTSNFTATEPENRAWITDDVNTDGEMVYIDTIQEDTSLTLKAGNNVSANLTNSYTVANNAKVYPCCPVVRSKVSFADKKDSKTLYFHLETNVMEANDGVVCHVSNLTEAAQRSFDFSLGYLTQ